MADITPKDNNFLNRRLFGVNIGGALDELKTRIGARMRQTPPIQPQGVDALYTPKYPFKIKSNKIVEDSEDGR